MATILSIVDSTLQAHAHAHVEQDLSEAQTSDIESDGEGVVEPRDRKQATGGPSIPQGSALDTESSASPYELPAFLSAPSTRIRRRSELSFSRPFPKFTIHDHRSRESGLAEAHAAHNAYELEDITPPAVQKLHYVGEEDLEKGKDVIIESGVTTPSRVPTLAYERDQEGPSAAQRAKYKMWSRLHMAALCYCFYVEGWNDGTTGPLIPRMQDYYNIGYIIVSIIFVVNCIGFIAGATANVWLSDKLGYGKVMLLGAVLQAITYAMQIPAGPFAVRVIAYGIAGFGIAIQNAGMNGYAGSLKMGTAKKLGLLHGSYGVGATTSPLVATYFSTAQHWTYHFAISLGLAALNIVFLAVVFRRKTLDDVMVEEGEELPEAQAGASGESKYSQIFKCKAVHYMALFSIIYIGVEVTMGGWIVTFIIRERQGGSSAGYISSGYFGGITAGRFFTVWINQKIGERRALFIYGLLCIALEATVWAVPSLIENAVAVSLIGVLMGPMYPILVNYGKDVLPRAILTGSLGWIVGIGQSGSAALPFITGLLAAKFGIGSMQPLLLSMTVVMVGVWLLIPKAQRRVD